MSAFHHNYRGIPDGPARQEFDRLTEEGEAGKLTDFFKRESALFLEKNQLRQSYLKAAIKFLPDYIKGEKVGETADFEFLIKHVDATIQKLEKTRRADGEESSYLNSVIRLANALKDLLDEGLSQHADLTLVQTQLKARLLEITKEINNQDLTLPKE